MNLSLKTDTSAQSFSEPFTDNSTNPLQSQLLKHCKQQETTLKALCIIFDNKYSLYPFDTGCFAFNFHDRKAIFILHTHYKQICQIVITVA